MQLKCKLCGYEFDSDDAEEADCNCGCGGSLVFCPNCSYEVRLPKEAQSNLTKKDIDRADNSFLGKVKNVFRMGN